MVMEYIILTAISIGYERLKEVNIPSE